MSEALQHHRRRHSAFYLAFGAGLLILIATMFLQPEKALLYGVLGFFLAYLVIAWSIVPKLYAVYLKRNAAETDLPSAIIFTITLAAVVTAVSSLFLALNSEHGAAPGEIIIMLASVVLGWLTIHTMAALHYAHLHWFRSEADAVHDREARRQGGLEFPGTEKPQGWDFLYFSFVVGMTAQTSDVAIRSSNMRKFNLAHSIVSFFFNTVLVAAAVNMAVSLAP
ncbi:DUF1345 domain-containing protein [Limoniibacter endophyticus]|uniref:Membrane protein n=1 Tax=Limoniibacter endophyticus TaxID=1565040 RepID=A0A8J3DPA9_9HYPH|nr:DUF1345 domain-containing protein [Limoniibacter endophyticus]GHC70538.1 membrane protein [Limoniibacter endophyticus]